MVRQLAFVQVLMTRDAGEVELIPSSGDIRCLKRINPVRYKYKRNDGLRFTFQRPQVPSASAVKLWRPEFCYLSYMATRITLMLLRVANEPCIFSIFHFITWRIFFKRGIFWMETLVCVYVVGRKLVLCKNPLETLDASYCSTDLVSPIQPWKAFPAYPRSTWSRVLCYMDLRRSLRLFFLMNQ